MLRFQSINLSLGAQKKKRKVVWSLRDFGPYFLLVLGMQKGICFVFTEIIKSITYCSHPQIETSKMLSNLPTLSEVFGFDFVGVAFAGRHFDT